MSLGRIDYASLNTGQKLAVHYFAVAMVLFVAQMLFGLLAAWQFVEPDFLFGVLDFNVNRMVHINAMVVWMLYGFIGSIYWLVEDESGVPLVGPRIAKAAFWVLTAAVTVVVAVYLIVQTGPGEHSTLWLINEGREYIEAPRWADIGIVVCMGAVFYNVAGTFVAGRWSGISGVLVLDMIALAGLYLAGMFYTTNLPMDQYWWWWVIHLWVEATWEVLVGCIMAWGLIKTLGARRHIVTTWLYIEVALMFGSGILGLGHHYFWIGTPEYWLGIGGFFSALEPVPLVAMVVHAVYDAGRHAFRASNHPALAWLIAHAFGNFFGAGVWGIHADAAADQSLYARHAMVVLPRPPRVFRGLRDDHRGVRLPGRAAAARKRLDVRRTRRRLALEVGAGAHAHRHGRHDGRAPDRGLRAGVRGTGRGRVDVAGLFRGPDAALVRRGDVVADGLRSRDDAWRCHASLGPAPDRCRRVAAHPGRRTGGGRLRGVRGTHRRRTNWSDSGREAGR